MSTLNIRIVRQEVSVSFFDNVRGISEPFRNLVETDPRTGEQRCERVPESVRSYPGQGARKNVCAPFVSQESVNLGVERIAIIERGVDPHLSRSLDCFGQIVSFETDPVPFAFGLEVEPVGSATQINAGSFIAHPASVTAGVTVGQSRIRQYCQNIDGTVKRVMGIEPTTPSLARKTPSEEIVTNSMSQNG